VQTDKFKVNNPLSPTAKKPVKAFKVGAILLLFSLTALVVALTFFLAFSNNREQHAINKKSYQAVFLQNGQVYFGKIASIGGNIIDLRGIYYLQSNSSSGSSSTSSSTDSGNVSLVKLGCELHAPYDQMIINNSQVLFWENIQDSSSVVKAITQYKQQNGDKINCSQSSQNSTQQAPSSSSSSNSSSSSSNTSSTNTNTSTSSTGSTGTTGNTGTTGSSSNSSSTNATTKTP